MWCAPSRRFAKGRTAFIDTVSGFKLLPVLTRAPLARLGYKLTVAGMLIMPGGGNNPLGLPRVRALDQGAL
jgi:hypothetical protein